MTLKKGYTYAFVGESWKASSSEEWDTVVYTPDGSELFAGLRKLDGSWCCVFKCQDGTYRAQTEVMCQCT